MRFQKLKIPAYGPFTDLELEFPTQGYDLHLIYGRNEAGKSSLLRAIRDLLFGIPAQSPDDFRHPYKALRLVGEVANSVGQTLEFQRRKGNRNTLLDKERQSLPDGALQPFLGGVDLSYFNNMFGLGSVELRDGARQLLRGEGQVGNALFSASLGGTHIQEVFDALIAESEQLFKGRSIKDVTIRPAVNRYKELLKLSRESMINPEAWDALEKELTEQEEIRANLEIELLALDRESAWIGRCADAWPVVGRWSEEVRALAELPEVPDLPSDFVERTRSARDSSNAAAQRVGNLTTQVAQLEEQLKASPDAPQILKDADLLDTLHQGLGAYQERKGSLARIEARLAGLEPGLRAQMRSLGLTGELNSLENLRLRREVRLRFDETARVFREAESKSVVCDEKLEESRREAQISRGKLEGIEQRDLTPLREALAIAAGATEASRMLPANESEVQSLVREVRDRQVLVVGAPHDPNATVELAVPTASTIREFRDRFEQLEREMLAERDKIAKARETQENLEAELRRLERRGELPSEQALRDARAHRDHGWGLVLAEWKGAGATEELVPGAPLEETFPKAIADTDRIADLLRLQAESVAQAEEKRLQIQEHKRRVMVAQEALSRCESALGQCQTEWEGQWASSGIKPRSSREMESWRDAWVEFRETLGRLRTAEAALKGRLNQVRSAREALATVLGESPGKEFLALFEEARSRVQNGEESIGRRKLIQEQLQAHLGQVVVLEKNRAGLLKAVETARTDWVAACQAVGLPDDVSPDSGTRLLEDREHLLAAFDEWTSKSLEAENIRKAQRQYEQEVAERATALCVPGDSTEAREAALWRSYDRARVVQGQREQLESQMTRARTERALAKQSEEQCAAAVGALMRLARVTERDELEPLLATIEKRQQVEGRIADFREALGGFAQGQSVHEFSSRVMNEDSDGFPNRLSQLEIGKTDKRVALAAVREALADLKRKKQEMERAGDAAAHARQQAEGVVAKLRKDASWFLRLRLAAHFLKAQIEQFRQENQGPLMEKSGRVFQAVTQGAFKSLDAEFDSRDIPVIVGRRNNGDVVQMDGLSEGSRDQLYLSLRLAALDLHLEEGHEPMPLILDDLLITFDDDRTRAILPQLADLSRRTQIFLFTHHEHVVELFRETLKEDQFTLHPFPGAEFPSIRTGRATSGMRIE